MAMTKQIWTRSAAVESGPKGRLIRVCKARVYQSTETTRRSHPGNWLNSHRSPLVHSTLSFSLPLCQPAPSSQPSSRLLISSIVWPYPLLPFPIILRQYMYKCMKLFVPPPVWRGGLSISSLSLTQYTLHLLIPVLLIYYSKDVDVGLTGFFIEEYHISLTGTWRGNKCQMKNLSLFLLLGSNQNDCITRFLPKVPNFDS